MNLKLKIEKVRAALFGIDQHAKKIAEIDAQIPGNKAELEKLGDIDAADSRALAKATQARTLSEALPQMRAKSVKQKGVLIFKLQPLVEELRLEIEKWRQAEKEALAAKIEQLLSPFAPPFTARNGEVFSPGRTFAQTAPIMRAIDQAAASGARWPEDRSRDNDPELFDRLAVACATDLVRIAETYIHQNDSFLPSDWAAKQAAS